MDDQQIIDAKNTYRNFKLYGFRENQLSAIKYICESKKKVVVLCSPTGSGKSLINMVSGRLHNRFTYLCSSKHLQSQLQTDFPECKIMFGRSNFACARFPALTADSCSHSKNNHCMYKKTDCFYEIQKKEVLRHPFKILNYHYFLYESVYIGRFSDPDGIILCDEADTLDSVLTGFVSVDVSYRQIQELGLQEPERKTATAQDGLKSWETWAFDTKKKTIAMIDKLSEQTDKADDRNQVYLARKLNGYKSLKSKLDMFLVSMDNGWIFERQNQWKGDGYTFSFKPVWLDKDMSKAAFFQHGNKFVMTSATFPPTHVLAKTLGVSAGDIDYVENPGAFPVTNRPVYISPVADLSYKHFDNNISLVLDKINDILRQHKGEKGIIHTTSWKLNKLVMGIDKERLVTHISSAVDKEQTIDMFRASNNDNVFVSPSSIRGLDLPDDLCRFSIIVKAPYLSLGDKLTKSRAYSSELGNMWYKSQCAQDMVQACGRGVRHKDDWCKNYIIDTQAFNLITREQKLFPRYFMDAVEVVSWQ